MDVAALISYLAPVLPLSAAALAGAVLGLERGSRKPAGYRTLALVSLGAGCFAQASASLPETDRIAAGVVAGVGFLGAGVVYKSGATVQNLTTAALIWIAAAAGLTAGMEAYIPTVATTVLALIVLRLPKPGERRR